MVVKFRELKEDIQLPLPEISITVAIPVLNAEWINSNGQNRDGVFIHEQSPLRLAWYLRIHKYQGNTSYRDVINLEKSEKYSGITLVALSCVRKKCHLLLNPFYFERLTKVNKSKCLALI